MSDEKDNVVEMPRPEVVGAPPPQAVPAAAPDAKKEVKLEDTKIAYVVGMDQEGNFIFQIFGKEAGLLQLLGIHAHADRQIQAIYDDKQMTGDRLTHEVGKAVGLINQKIDQMLAVIAPKKPDNAL
jgi:hypothetical protein